MSDKQARRRRPGIRLIWDEQLSSKVAEALRVLGFRVTWVGASDPGVPGRGSSDRAVIEFAQQVNQVVVTMNHDMMTLCDEIGQRFVWIDPRGRQLATDQQVLLAFGQISRWQELLDENPGMCVRSMRTKCLVIESTEAARLARQRMRKIERRSVRTRAKATSGLEPLDGLD